MNIMADGERKRNVTMAKSFIVESVYWTRSLKVGK